jgi:AAA+ superfamily predicted ATPase
MSKSKPENEQPQNAFTKAAREIDATLIDLQLRQFSKSKHTAIQKVVTALKNERTEIVDKVVVFSSKNVGLRIIAGKILATELGLPLYLLDLPLANEKYIGETEKNLTDLFEAASEIEGILLFDETDALFHSSEKDEDADDELGITLDEVLSSVENAKGVIILTTNDYASSPIAETKTLKLVFSI